MLRFLSRSVATVLSVPLFFEWQQRLCNNYGAIGGEFAQYLKTEGKSVLDVGCSTGACAGTVVDMGRNRYVGVDIEPRYVATAARRYPLGTFLTMDARSLRFDRDSFDVVLFVGAMHHMESDLIRSCLAEVRRVLKKGTGVVLVAEPVFTPGWRLSTLCLRLDRGKHIRTVDGYRQLFDGFSVAREGHFRFSLHRFCSFVLKAV